MKQKTRKLSIKAKLLMIMGWILILVVLGISLVTFNRTESHLIGLASNQAESAAKMALKEIDADVLATLKPGDESSDGYVAMREALIEVQETCGIAYLYTLTTDKATVSYGIDTDQTDNQALIGDEFEETYEDLADVFDGNPYIQEFIDASVDGDLITVYLPITNSSGEVVAVLGSDYDAAPVQAKLNSLRVETAAIGGICIILGIIIMGIMVFSITGNLNKVNNKLYELVHNEGDLTQTINVNSGDESELLAGNVNDLVGYMRTIMIQISENATTLNASSKDVVDELNVAGEGITDLSATMQEMSASMEETTATLSQVSEAVSNISLQISDIESKASECNDTTQKITAYANALHRESEDNQSKARISVEEMSALVNAKIEQSKAVEEINVLTNDILSITNQTNLLALNASIEAARAGEAGRGFAVVADEISTLATNSADAATKIQQVSFTVIEAVRGLATASERMLEFLNETTMDGYDKLLATSSKYSNEVSDINQMMSDFAQIAKQVEDAITVICESISAVDIAVEESSKGVISVTETAVNLTNTVSNIQDHAYNNSTVADALNIEVSKFKLH